MESCCCCVCDDGDVDDDAADRHECLVDHVIYYHPYCIALIMKKKDERKEEIKGKRVDLLYIYTYTHTSHLVVVAPKLLYIKGNS